MADEFDAAAAGFWLPDEFLDDDFFADEKAAAAAAAAARSDSDEEDALVGGLSRRMAGLDCDGAIANKGEVVAGSPQSTLCGLHASGEDSPTGAASQVSSPPSSPLDKQPADPWDLLHEAAGQVARLPPTTGSIPVPKPNAAVAPPPPKHAAPLLPAPKPATTGSNYQYTSHAQRQAQIARFHLLKQQQVMKHQQLAMAMAWGGAANDYSPLGLGPSAWPPLQKQAPNQPPAPASTNAGMRAVFLTPPGAKRECAGTGVFIPRQAGAPAEPRKKQGCSSVLLPARVVQALNLNVEDLGARPCYPGGFVVDHEALVNRSNAMQASQRREQNNVNAPAAAAAAHSPPLAVACEVNLPQEWTY
ncbi:myosin-1-like [Lolium rigidum]|uniref:myosin-1-like n=1 Tax=Lolium rigidum TaxID=89674 RepID=UPI001F5C2B4C|nr:myosin-1-like [Lolium rigidum]